jgi:hypothetical protein
MTHGECRAAEPGQHRVALDSNVELMTYRCSAGYWHGGLLFQNMPDLGSPQSWLTEEECWTGMQAQIDRLMAELRDSRTDG